MTPTATVFMQDWIADNLHFEGFPDEDGPSTREESLAIKCAADAELQGISKEILEKEFGDLPTYIHAQFERIADEQVAAKVARAD